VTRNGMFAGRFTPETNLHAIDESEIQCEWRHALLEIWVEIEVPTAA
jgi:hypothetical protein